MECHKDPRQRAISVVKGAGNAYGRPGDCSGAAKVPPKPAPLTRSQKAQQFFPVLGLCTSLLSKLLSLLFFVSERTRDPEKSARSRRNAWLSIWKSRFPCIFPCFCLQRQVRWGAAFVSQPV